MHVSCLKSCVCEIVAGYFEGLIFWVYVSLSEILNCVTPLVPLHVTSHVFCSLSLNIFEGCKRTTLYDHLAPPPPFCFFDPVVITIR